MKGRKEVGGEEGGKGEREEESAHGIRCFDLH